MLLPALALVAEIAAQHLPLDEIAGIRLAESESVVSDRMRGFGPVTRSSGALGGVQLAAGSVKVTLCEGRVVHVERRLGQSVHEFARIAEDMLTVNGPPLSPDIFAIDYRRPPAAGGRQSTITVIRLSWAKAPAYFLGYSEVGDDHEVIEALNADNPCRAGQPPTH